MRSEPLNDVGVLKPNYFRKQTTMHLAKNENRKPNLHRLWLEPISLLHKHDKKHKMIAGKWASNNVTRWLTARIVLHINYNTSQSLHSQASMRESVTVTGSSIERKQNYDTWSDKLSDWSTVDVSKALRTIRQWLVQADKRLLFGS